MNGFIWCRTAKLPKDVKRKAIVPMSTVGIRHLSVDNRA
jgi:hypothetical protein